MTLHLQALIWHDGRQQQLHAVKLPTIVLPSGGQEVRKMLCRPPAQMGDRAALLRRSNSRLSECGLEGRAWNVVMPV
jgi:hypothetical protein